MSDLVDRTIAALRANHDQLAEVVGGLTEEQLTAPSGASEWSVADVLSHLGSGAEIGRYPVLVAITESQDVVAPANQEVWDRWNAMSAQEQAARFVESDELSVATFETLTSEQRASVTVDLGFLPEPVPLATALGMRLNEQALHSWDVRVALDPAAALSEESAALLAEHFSSTMSFLLGFIGKPEGVEPTRVSFGEYAIVLDEGVRLTSAVTDPTATFDGPLEAGIRLLAGRLGPEHTPEDTTVTGNVSLEDLRKAFPGY